MPSKAFYLVYFCLYIDSDLIVFVCDILAMIWGP